MKKYDWKNEYNPIRRTAKRLLSGEPLTDGRPLLTGPISVIRIASTES